MAHVEYCELCGRKLPRRELVRKTIPHGYDGGSNALPYSSYNTAAWTDGITAGNTLGGISFGAFAYSYRPYLTEAVTSSPSGLGPLITDTVVEQGGSQTFAGSGEVWVGGVGAGIDCSSWSKVAFTVAVGVYPSETTQTLTVVLGACDATASVIDVIRTWSVVGQRECWYSADPADFTTTDVSDLYFHLSVTVGAASQKWWVDRAWAGDSTDPLMAVKVYTRGTAVATRAQGYHIMPTILCPTCASEPIVKDEPVEPRSPEFTEIADASGWEDA